MASYVRNIRTKNYLNLIIVFQVTVENVGDVFLRHSVLLGLSRIMLVCNFVSAAKPVVQDEDNAPYNSMYTHFIHFYYAYCFL